MKGSVLQMFEKIIVAVILVLAVAVVFSGCDRVEKIEDQLESRADQIEDAVESKLDPIESKADAVEDAIESKLDSVEDAVESKADAVEDIIENNLNPVEDILKDKVDTVKDAFLQAATDTAVTQNALIGEEEAKRIALNHAGLSAEEVVFDRTDRDCDNGIYHYEVEFHVGLTEYEYDIHAESGEILSFEKDS